MFDKLGFLPFSKKLLTNTDEAFTEDYKLSEENRDKVVEHLIELLPECEEFVFMGVKDGGYAVFSAVGRMDGLLLLVANLIHSLCGEDENMTSMVMSALAMSFMDYQIDKEENNG